MTVAHPDNSRIFEMFGRITLAWNSIETLWYLVFTTLMHDAARDKCDVIFYHFRTAAAQRELVMAVADPALSKQPDLRAKLGVLNGRTTDLSSLRNAFVHAEYGIEIVDGPLKIKLCASHPDLKKATAARKKLEKDMVALVNDITLLKLDLEVFLDICVHPDTDFLPPENRRVPISELIPPGHTQRFPLITEL